ncbi:MAG: DUF4123 domain-containing protein [Burkholderiaceae bacterium]|nr:DUF4123 domain-containing protein [Burkholderiaceae bacterium]
MIPENNTPTWYDQALGAHDIHLAAIVDASQDDRIYPLLQEMGWQHTCLYASPASAKLACYAPYYVPLRDAQAVQTLEREGGASNWAIYLTHTGSSGTVIRHLKKFLFVRNAQQRRVYFRFYDPRVLRWYLSSCSHEQLDQFFGSSIQSFYANAPNAQQMWEYPHLTFRDMFRSNRQLPIIKAWPAARNTAEAATHD